MYLETSVFLNFGLRIKKSPWISSDFSRIFFKIKLFLKKTVSCKLQIGCSVDQSSSTSIAGETKRSFIQLIRFFLIKRKFLSVHIFNTFFFNMVYKEMMYGKSV